MLDDLLLNPVTQGVHRKHNIFTYLMLDDLLLNPVTQGVHRKLTLELS